MKKRGNLVIPKNTTIGKKKSIDDDDDFPYISILHKQRGKVI